MIPKFKSSSLPSSRSSPLRRISSIENLVVRLHQVCPTCAVHLSSSASLLYLLIQCNILRFSLSQSFTCWQIQQHQIRHACNQTEANCCTYIVSRRELGSFCPHILRRLLPSNLRMFSLPATHRMVPHKTGPVPRMCAVSIPISIDLTHSSDGQHYNVPNQSWLL